MDGAEKKTTKWIAGILLFFSVVLIVCVRAMIFISRVFQFEGMVPYSDKNYSYGILLC